MRANTNILTLIASIFALVVGLMMLGPLAQPMQAATPSATPVVIDVDLPSSSTGSSGGTLALRVLAPPNLAAARYGDGAPVMIFVPGGDSEGTLKPRLLTATDSIRIVFIFPGGYDATVGRGSDGTYDHRGEDSIIALRDVVRFAAGEVTDSSGRTIDDLLSVPVLHDNIGLLGASNGGNIVVSVDARYGAALAGHLRYVVQWESPVSSQIATVDLGGINLDCAPGKRQRMDVVNPRYLAYGYPALNVDHSQLAYDPADIRHPIFFDGNGDGHYTTVLDSASGCRTPDLNNNGVLEANEDWPLRAYTDGVKHIFSRPITQALADYGVFGGSWPSGIATVPEADAYWEWREAVRLFPAALINVPDLEGMVLASLEDHMQSAPDHPHIHQAFTGWDSAGAWVQINPDPAYLAQADPSLSGRSDLPANAPNTPPADWSDETTYTIPEDVENETYQTAAMWQMADRAHNAGSPSPTPIPTPSTYLYLPIYIHL